MTPAQRRNLEGFLPDSGIAEDIRAALADLDTLRSDLARVTAERDALRAEVDAMHVLLVKARKWVGAVPAEWPNEEVIEVKKALDALRARKVGG